MASHIKADTVHEIFKGVWKDTGTRGSKDAMALAAHLLESFATEALQRAATLASSEQSSTKQPVVLGVQELENIVPHLLLEF
jgi:histone H3/H4